MSYARTLSRVEDYFDRTATKAWEALTSDAPVSRVRATVREGRDRMRGALLGELPEDLRGARVLDAGCGTGALAMELARRGADVVAIDISPSLVAIARERCEGVACPRIDFRTGDMLDESLGGFDAAVAMDSLIYYDEGVLARAVQGALPRLGRLLFTVAPRTPLLMAMWRAGKLFPRADRSPAMVPQSAERLAEVLRPARLRDLGRISSGFYISHALEAVAPRGARP